MPRSAAGADPVQPGAKGRAARVRQREALHARQQDGRDDEPARVLRGELAYVFVQLGQREEAIAAYLRAVSLCGEHQAASKAEFAMNLGLLYHSFGNTADRDAWLEKARTWAPEGSTVAARLRKLPPPPPAGPPKP